MEINDANVECSNVKGCRIIYGRFEIRIKFGREENDRVTETMQLHITVYVILCSFMAHQIHEFSTERTAKWELKETASICKDYMNEPAQNKEKLL